MSKSFPHKNVLLLDLEKHTVVVLDGNCALVQFFGMYQYSFQWQRPKLEHIWTKDKGFYINIGVLWNVYLWEWQRNSKGMNNNNTEN